MGNDLRKLLRILACPLCKKELIFAKNKLICKSCNKEYEIKDDMPILLP